MMEQLLFTDEPEFRQPTVDQDRPLGDALRVPPAPPAGLDTALFDSDDALARRDLRTQIARFEESLARLFAAAFPRTGIEWAVPAAGGPRVLSVAELERVRDALAVRLREATRALDEQTGTEAAFRGLIEEMNADPAAHRWIRVSNSDIGEPGCRHWHSRPRWGLFGMLMGWWRVKVSSGCPLATGCA